MLKILFCLSFVCLQLCYAEPTGNVAENEKALEKIENLLSDSQYNSRQNTNNPANEYNSDQNPNRADTRYNRRRNTDNYNQQQPPQTQESEHNYPETADGNNSAFKKAFYKTIFILFGVIILVFIGIWLFRKFSIGKTISGNNLRTIKVLEKRPISPKSMLYLIEVGGQKILISESQFEVRAISELEWLENSKQGL